MTTHEHVPVLLDEVLEAFEGQSVQPAVFFEGTFGRGGHTHALRGRFPQMKIHAFDKDPEAIASGRIRFADDIQRGTLVLTHDDFKNFETHGFGPFDGALVDLGVSSPQLDVAERGFSFMHDGPLDMRMDSTQKVTAAHILGEYSEKDLAEVFIRYGEVRSAFKIARAIVHDRKTQPYTSTRQLAGMIERVEGWKKKGSHPATGYFMALRIAVNEELSGLEEFLEGIVAHLNEGCRLAVISFHSLEDRIVKNMFRSMHSPCVCPPQLAVCQCGKKSKGSVITRKIVAPSEDEVTRNPRARSAKMRVFEKHALESSNTSRRKEF